MSVFYQTYPKKHRSLILSKRFYFSIIRAYQEISLYRGRQLATDRELNVLHVGNPKRGRYFIESLFGYYPEQVRLGRSIVWSLPKRLRVVENKFDIVMVEINRLFAQSYRQLGYFTIPEWVEFGREIIRDPKKRYADAKKSLKSDLNKIRRSDFRSLISRDLKDFHFFYDRMYLPHISRRYGDAMIAKSKKQLKKIFSGGFLLILKKPDQPVAGALVRIDDDVITENCIGVLEGKEELLKYGVSGFMDYHLHEWAADHNMHFINVGHTRPFPLDGIYFNKRKWMMSIMPDQDGVMDMAVKIRVRNRSMAGVFKACPFVFQTNRGLAVFCGHDGQLPASRGEINKLIQSYELNGLSDMIIVSVTGFTENVMPNRDATALPHVHLFSGIDVVAAWQRGLSPSGLDGRLRIET